MKNLSSVIVTLVLILVSSSSFADNSVSIGGDRWSVVVETVAPPAEGETVPLNDGYGLTTVIPTEEQAEEGIIPHMELSYSNWVVIDKNDTHDFVLIDVYAVVGMPGNHMIVTYFDKDARAFLSVGFDTDRYMLGLAQFEYR